MRKGEEPGFRPRALPGAVPRSRGTITGVKALVIPLTFQPIRGPRTTGVTNVAVYETAEGAKHSLAHGLRPCMIRALGPVENLRYITVPGVPGARGWTASKPHVGNLHWVQGRCMLVLGNHGPGPFAGPMSASARAIYEHTHGECP